MSQATPTLPAGWSTILDDVRARLDLALASAEARIEAMPVLAVPSPCAHQQDFAHLSVLLHGLSDRLHAAQKVIQEVDAALLVEEKQLQEQQALSRTLPQKLAAWAGRAIG
jgi:hypothetical protein